MAESHVLAASLGFALAGVGVLALMAGCTVNPDGLADTELVDELEQQVPATSVPVVRTSRSIRVDTSPPPSATAATTVPTSVRPTPIAEGANDVRSPGGDRVDTPSDEFAAPMLAVEEAEEEAADEAGVDISGRFEPYAVAGDIRSVDFLNGFTFPVAGVGPITVDRGFAAARPSGNRLDLQVDHVTYGDVTRDGVDDAVIAFHYTDQWGDDVAIMRVFSIQDGMLQDWGWSWADYGSQGKILSVKVSHGLISAESLNIDATMITTARWEVQGVATSLQRVEVLPARVFADLQNRATEDPFEAVGANGALRVVVAARGGAGQLISFEANAGWTLVMRSTTDNATALRIWEPAGGRLIGDVTKEVALQLTGEGRYVGQVIGDADVTFELEAADQRTLGAATWVPTSWAETSDDDVGREIRLHYPELTSAAGAANLNATNATIRTFVDELVANHRASVDSTCEADERSMLWLSYQLTLISYDLISIVFDEFVCLCENGDYTETHSLTIDLNTGRRLGVESLLVGGTQSENDVWWQATQADDWYPGFLYEDRDPEFVAIQALSLRHDGIDVVAEMQASDGETFYQLASLAMADVAGLIDPAIATRAASGAAVAIPIDEGCGC